MLRPGDLVRLVSPSGPTRAERVARGVELFTGWGLRVEVAPNAYARRGYLAGTDEERLDDLNAALADPQVRAVVCTRGGYGVQRIVDGLDLDAIRADPKLVVGCSDITALQLALWRAAGLVTVHGPGAAWLDKRTGPEAAESLRSALLTTDPVTVSAREHEETSPLRIPGPPATGPLLGGNLCMLVSTVGTIDQPVLVGAILLLEDVDEGPYKVDGMLLQLRRSGVLNGLHGVAVGQFTNCADDWPTSIVDVLTDHLGRLGVPVLGGLPIGHGLDQRTVPVGADARLDVDAGTLTVQAATSP